MATDHIGRIAEFRVRADGLGPTRDAIARLVRAVRDGELSVPRYEAYERGGRRFLYVMEFDASAQRRHRGTEHIQAFVATLYPRCEEEPDFTDLTPAGGEGR